MATPPQLAIDGAITVTQDGRASVFVSANGTIPQLSFNATNAGGRAWNVTVVAYPVGNVDVDSLKTYAFDANALDCSIWTIPGATHDSNGDATDGTARVTLRLSHMYNAGTGATDANGEPLHTFLYQILLNAMPDGSDARTTCGGSTHYNTYDYGCDPRTKDPDGVTPDTTCTGQSCDPTGAACAGGNQEQDMSDNFAFIGLVRDAKLSWSVDPETARWCRGAPTASTCDTDWTHDWTTTSPYNTARSRSGSAPDATYFQVGLSTVGSTIPIAPGATAPWRVTKTAMRNLSAPACAFDAQIAMGADMTTGGARLDATHCPAYDPDLVALARPDHPGTNATTIAVKGDTACAPCSLDADAGDEYTFRSSTLPLVDPESDVAVAGDWTATLALTDGSMVDPDFAVAVVPFHVFAPDLTAKLGPDPGATSPATAYDYPEGHAIPTIHAFGNLSNVGDAAPLAFTAGGATATIVPVNYLFVIDNRSSDPAFSARGMWASPEPGADPFAASADLDHLSSDPDATSPFAYITPGRHTLCLMVDLPSAVNETDESTASNTDCVAFYLKDTEKPTISPIDVPSTETRTPRVTSGPYYDDPAASGGHDSFANASIDATHENQTFSMNVNASDNDQAGLNVSVIATLADPVGATIQTRAYYPCVDALNASTTQPNCFHVRGDASAGYAANITGFGFATNASVENWTLAVVVSDASGHNATASTTLQVQRWPIQTIPADDVVYGICSARTVPSPTGASNCSEFYNGTPRFAFNDPSTEISYHIHIEDEWTGIDDQWNHSNNTGNVVLIVSMPGNKTFTTATWQHSSECQTLPVDVGGTAGQPPTCFDHDNLTSVNLTALRAPHGPGTPGLWNVTIVVRDASHRTRSIDRSFFLYDQPPALTNGTTNESTIPAGQHFQVRVNVTDDFGVNETFVNLTRISDGVNVSLPLVEHTDGPVEDGNVSYVYAQNFTTGHGHAVGISGTFNVTFATLDLFGNWAELAAASQLTIVDDAAPILSGVTAGATFVETGENVTFRAHANDASNTTVTLHVFRGSAVILDANMTENNATTGDYSFMTSFLTAGAYTFTMRAVDSLGLQSAATSKQLYVETNLPPRIDVWDPILIGETRQSNATPVIRAFAADANNVSIESFEMSVDGTRVPAEEIQADGLAGRSGVLFTYALPSSLANGRTVVVNISVRDESADALTGHADLTFTVDATPPTVLVSAFEPSFRDGPRLYVAPGTRFTATATDNASVDSGVSLLQYRVCSAACGPGSGVPRMTYAGPFAITDGPVGQEAAYDGPGVYEVDLWATDGVGNTNASPPLFVIVDDKGPSLDSMQSSPADRSINVTLSDADSGVDRAVVWWSVNEGPYQSLPLDRTRDTWHAVLPNGARGDVIKFHVEAWDHVGNSRVSRDATGAEFSVTIGDRAPSVKITAPTAGTTVSDVARIEWDASDPDHDRLLLAISYLPSTGGPRVELARASAGDASSFSWDVANLSEGNYHVTVTASDGTLQTSADVEIQVSHTLPIISVANAFPERVPEGDPVLLTAQVAKPNATVAAEVFLDGVSVGVYPMNDAGLDGDVTAGDGIHSARVTLSRSGDYSVAFHAIYQENGRARTADLGDAGSFAVRLTAASVIKEHTTMILLIVLGTAACVGIAAWRFRLRT